MESRIRFTGGPQTYIPDRISGLKLKPLSEMQFRANPDLELLVWTSDGDSGTPQLSGSGSGQDLVGVLRSRSSNRSSVFGVRKETARLFRHMQSPTGLPRQLCEELGADCDRVVATLVLDQVLELECDGIFVSGATAYPLLWQEAPVNRPIGRLSQMSIDGLQMAQALAYHSPLLVASRLYQYNRLPISPAWRRRLSDQAAVSKFLGLSSDHQVHHMLENSWQTVRRTSPINPGWLTWQFISKDTITERPVQTYKLYVSPAPDHVPEAFEAAVATFTESRTPVFKVGRDHYGLLRPDKLIGYFWNHDDLLSASERLHNRLKGCPPHGVPFTTEIAENGLLSWGMDPPDEEGALGIGRESWRSWLARRMATAMLEAIRSKVADLEPWQYVLGRLQLDGIDTNAWTPTKVLWN